MNGSLSDAGRLVPALIGLMLMAGVLVVSSPVQASSGTESPFIGQTAMATTYYRGFEISPNDYALFEFNLTSGQLIEYSVEVEDGAGVEFYILTEEQFEMFKVSDNHSSLLKVTVPSSSTVSDQYITNYSGMHYLAIYNPSTSQSSNVEFGTNLDILGDIMDIIETVCMVCAGIIVLIIIIVAFLLLSGRKKGRGPQQQTYDVNYSLDDVSSSDGDSNEGESNREARHEPRYDPPSYDDEPYKRDSFLRRRKR